MKKVKVMTDYEKTVSIIAGRVYTDNLKMAVDSLKENEKEEGVDSDQILSESVAEAFEIVDGVLAITRHDQ